MDDTKCRITVLHGLDNDADRKQVVDLVQCLVLIDHFPVNAEEMLDAAIYLRLNARLFHVGRNFIYNAFNKLLARILSKGNLLSQVVINLRLQIF